VAIVQYTKHTVTNRTKCIDERYAGRVPKLWDATIEAHRREVRQAILETAGALVATHGLLSLTMSQIAEETGIGRATLYKYFPDVEAILRAWHECQISGHLAQLAEISGRPTGAGERLSAVLEAYALIAHESRGHHGTEIGALLHRDHQVAQAQQQVCELFRDLLAQSAEAGDVRDDVPPEELANFCLHALTAAASLPSKMAVHRLIALTLAGLRP
jgi:AcrR family transcriptional regulator